MDNRDELLDRMLEQSKSSRFDYVDDEDDINAMWTEELLDLKEQLKSQKREDEMMWKARTLKHKRRQRLKVKRLAKELPGAGAHTLPAYITDSNLWFQHAAEKKRKNRLKSVQSSFQQFPELSKHMFKRCVGSKNKKINVSKEIAKTQQWENNRLRKQLKGATKKVLQCCSYSYVQKTNETKLLIEISRTTMGSKILLEKVVPLSNVLSNGKDEQQNIYDGNDFGIDAGLDDLHEANAVPPGSPPGTPTSDMLRFLKEKAAYHKSETSRYGR
jgi:hypothetical protein